MTPRCDTCGRPDNAAGTRIGYCWRFDIQGGGVTLAQTCLPDQATPQCRNLAAARFRKLTPAEVAAWDQVCAAMRDPKVQP